MLLKFLAHLALALPILIAPKEQRPEKDQYSDHEQPALRGRQRQAGFVLMIIGFRRARGLARFIEYLACLHIF